MERINDLERTKAEQKESRKKVKAMPLTAAEKMRRYREKLQKQRPEEYKAQKQKARIRALRNYERKKLKEKYGVKQ